MIDGIVKQEAEGNMSPYTVTTILLSSPSLSSLSLAFFFIFIYLQGVAKHLVNLGSLYVTHF